MPGAQDRVDLLLREEEAERDRRLGGWGARRRAYWREPPVPPGWGGSAGAGGGAGRPGQARDPAGHYRALGLEPGHGTSLADIKAAFRGRAKSLHPDTAAAADVGQGPPVEAFRRVLAAYQALRDPRERRRYDAL